MITLGGCDKSVPGALQPIARLDIPGITLFGGPALPGKCTDHITLTNRGLDPGKVRAAEQNRTEISDRLPATSWLKTRKESRYPFDDRPTAHHMFMHAAD